MIRLYLILECKRLFSYALSVWEHIEGNESGCKCRQSNRMSGLLSVFASGQLWWLKQARPCFSTFSEKLSRSYRYCSTYFRYRHLYRPYLMAIIVANISFLDFCHNFPLLPPLHLCYCKINEWSGSEARNCRTYSWQLRYVDGREGRQYVI